MIFFMIVPNIAYNPPGNGFRIDVVPTAAGDLARIDNQIMSHQGLDGDAAFFIRRQAGVQNRVG
jgi:hypothetical protein